MGDFQQRVIEEFRSTGGIVGGRFAGLRLLLLTTTGRKSGERRTNPAQAFEKDGEYYVIAAKHGHPKHPLWYDNLVAEPQVHIEIGTDGVIEGFDAVAAPVPQPDRDSLFAEFCLINPHFAEHQEKADRVIPIVHLARA
jgi:deazaflavin-dependent oxidoreductase (nitroreductase family)